MRCAVMEDNDIIINFTQRHDVSYLASSLTSDFCDYGAVCRVSLSTGKSCIYFPMFILPNLEVIFDNFGAIVV